MRVALRVVGRVARSFGRAAPVGADLVDTLVADVSVPAERIRDELGFAPRIDLASGLAGMVADRRRNARRPPDRRWRPPVVGADR